MSPPRSALPPGLNELLKALRTAGLPVGTREILRLQRVFALEPVLEEDALRRVLAAGLVHSPEEQAIFDPVYREWRRRWEGLEVEAAGDVKPVVIRQWKRIVRQRRRRWLVPAAVGTFGIGAVVLGLWLWLQQEAPPPFFEDDFRILEREPLPDTIMISIPRIEITRTAIPSTSIPSMSIPPTSIPSTSIPSTSTPSTIPSTSIPSTIPSTSIPSMSFRTLAPFLSVGFLITSYLLAAWAGYRRYAGANWANYRRDKRPREVPPPTLPGPQRVPYLPLADTGPELLDNDGARTLVWGVGRHQTEDLTPEIDMEQTADATAQSAGLPELRFVPEKRLREVWLWLDGLTDDPDLGRYADEIATSLEQNGLPIRIGSFDGYPTELAWDEGQVVRPGELEGHRQTALVAVMTNGSLAVEHSRDNRRQQLVTLLQALGTWEHLAVVDFSTTSEHVELMAGFNIACVKPEALPEFFGLGGVPSGGFEGGRDSTVEKERHAPDPEKIRTWAAALAFARRPVERSDAYALRRELGIDVSPWDLRALESLEATGALGVHLDWAEDAPRQVRWLCRAESDDRIIRRVSAFWDRRLEEEDRQRLERGGLEGWAERPARRYLAMERALLKLWRDDPTEAAEELAALAAADERLAAEIQRRLGSCGDDSTGELDKVPLPWRLGQLPGAVRRQLQSLGLDVGRGRLKSPGRLALAVGALVGLGLAFYGGAFRQAGNPVSADLLEPTLDCGIQPEGAFCQHYSNGWAYAGMPLAVGSEIASRRLQPGDRARVIWGPPKKKECVLDDDEAQIWRCARDTRIRLAMPWPKQRFAMVELPASDPDVRSFSQTLLDSGSVDALVLGMDAASHAVEWAVIGPRNEDQEWLWFVGEDRSIEIAGFSGRTAIVEVRDVVALEQALRGLPEATPLSEIESASVTDGDSSLPLHYCPGLEGVHEPTGMSFVWVCGGQFRMGSEDDDPEAYDAEKPAHEVALTGFWIGKHEVSYKELRSWKPDISGRDEMPAANIDWHDSRQFCQSLGTSEDWEYDLPSEAQWEFAARGHEGRRYPWGDEEPRRDIIEPEAVGGRQSGMGPFGTLDQGGNIWEWILDCYDPNAYAKRQAEGGVQLDPLVGGKCWETPSALRVLRGGSFADGPRALRSANRLRYVPEVRVEVIGFRCVRRPRLQP